MTDSAWVVVDEKGETVTAYWFREWAEEYIDEHNEPLTVVEIPALA